MSPREALARFALTGPNESNSASDRFVGGSIGAPLFGCRTGYVGVSIGGLRETIARNDFAGAVGLLNDVPAGLRIHDIYAEEY